MLIKDVKPDNFMVDESGRVYFIDFGLMERMSSFDAGVGGKFEGTPSYASVAAHDGAPVCKHDDIESLGWVLLALAEKGTLPWSHCKSDADCKRMKRDCDVRQLAATRLCEEVGSFILLSRETARTAAPAYTALRKILERMKTESSRGSAIARNPSPARQRLKREKNSTSQSDQDLVQQTSPAPQRVVKRRSSDVAEADVGPFESTVGSSPVTKKHRLHEENASNSPFTSTVGAEFTRGRKAATFIKDSKKSRLSNESSVSIASSSSPPSPFASTVEGRYPKRKRIAKSTEYSPPIDLCSPHAYIEVLEGPRAGEKLPITSALDPGTLITIGRENADVNIHDECISEWYSN